MISAVRGADRMRTPRTRAGSAISVSACARSARARHSTMSCTQTLPSRRIAIPISSPCSSWSRFRALFEPMANPGSMLLDALERLADLIENVVDRIGRVTAWLVLAVVFLLFVQNPPPEYIGRGHVFANAMGQLAPAAAFIIGLPSALRWG